MEYLVFNKIRLDELIKILEKYYCGKIGTQFMHIQDKEQRDWIMDKIENIKPEEIFTDKGKKAILERLTAAEFFEIFWIRNIQEQRDSD